MEWKIKEWKITKAKGTKFRDTNMHQNQVKQAFAMGCQLGEMVRKGGELTYNCSGINNSKVCDSNIHKKTIKYSNLLDDRQQD